MVPDIAYLDVVGETYLYDKAVGASEVCLDRRWLYFRSEGDRCLEISVDFEVLCGLMNRLIAEFDDPDKTLPGMVLLWSSDPDFSTPVAITPEDLIAAAYLLRDLLDESELWEEPGRVATFLARFGLAALTGREQIWASF